MRLTIFAATFAFLLWGTPAFAGSNPDLDLDGVGDVIDNCSENANPAQDDTDGDDCGNLCDANYDQEGTVGFGDFGAFTNNGFGNIDELYNHTEPVDDTVGFGDFGFFTQQFGAAPGPSGTTAGTTACP
jgi:hypothetical protein